MRHHLSTIAACLLYNNASEDVLHVLRDCIQAKTIWTQVINRWKLADFDRLPLHEWFTCILSKPDDYIKDGEDRASRRLNIKTNNVEVVELRHGNSGTLRSNTLVSTIQHMLHLDWDVQIRKIGRDYNKATDVLARASRGAPVGETIFHSTPSVVYDLLQEDF
ncbi:hypothetical protein V6N11_039799 [Hibiscus sabdariffa]|uniref:RNase H type-1 domain-containing protein n=1 Tax=Hibiscus sabdariffa TaxID=183260 RepID=A0ABR2RFI7_9ROSI